MATHRNGAYRRFDLGQRIEHGVLIVSFSLLAISGLPQKYPDSWWGETMIRLMGGIEMTRVIHHVAAIALILQVVYHVLVLGYKLWVLRYPLDMMPGWRDVRNAIGVLGYNLGKMTSPPRMGRYTFGEKLEYWAVVWGTLIMVLTGFVLWNPILVTRFLPGEFVPAAKAAHGGEALLAVLSIITWHVFNVHIKHFNRSMFSGYLSQHVMEEEHALELEAPATVKPATKTLRTRRAIYLPLAAIITLVMMAGVYLFLTYEHTAITTVPRQTIDVYVPVDNETSP